MLQRVAADSKRRCEEVVCVSFDSAPQRVYHMPIALASSLFHDLIDVVRRGNTRSGRAPKRGQPCRNRGPGSARDLWLVRSGLLQPLA